MNVVYLNTKLTRLALIHIFNFDCKFYDLEKYEHIQDGLGIQILNMIEDEFAHQRKMRGLKASVG